MSDVAKDLVPEEWALYTIISSVDNSHTTVSPTGLHRKPGVLSVQNIISTNRFSLWDPAKIFSTRTNG
jgi:hypothetical protein